MVKKSLLLILVMTLVGFIIGTVGTLWECSATVPKRIITRRITKVVFAIFYAGCFIFSHRYFKKNFPKR